MVGGEGGLTFSHTCFTILSSKLKTFMEPPFLPLGDVWKNSWVTERQDLLS